MSNTPTDAEIESTWTEATGSSILPYPNDMLAFARAVLAKWGTQPVVREPLTPEQISAMSRKHPAEDLCGWSYRLGIADAEAHYGITQKGGSNAE